MPNGPVKLVGCSRTPEERADRIGLLAFMSTTASQPPDASRMFHHPGEPVTCSRFSRARIAGSANRARSESVPPCGTFSDDQQSLEGTGQRFENFANISLAVGAAAAVGAGVLWYLDARDRRKRRRAREESRGDEPNLSAVPVIGEDFVGGAAAVRF